jgi:hypothetical protein
LVVSKNSFLQHQQLLTAVTPSVDLTDSEKLDLLLAEVTEIKTALLPNQGEAMQLLHALNQELAEVRLNSAIAKRALARLNTERTIGGSQHTDGRAKRNKVSKAKLGKTGQLSLEKRKKPARKKKGKA